jgi:hypothetical protein
LNEAAEAESDRSGGKPREGVMHRLSAWMAAWALAGSAFADGTCVVRVTMRDARDVMLMSQLSGDCWSHQADEAGRMDWRVRREDLRELDALGLAYEMFIPDVEAIAAEERARLEAPFGERDWFDDFKPYAEVSAFADSLVQARPDIVRREAIGQSFEGREIFALRLTSPEGGGFEGGKPVILLNSLQHAREWVSVMATMYLVNRLATEWAPGSADADILNRYEVVLVPMVNPDGYVYTWTTDRFWRKTRRPNGNGAFGIDPNRNWGYEWGRNNGSSPDPRSDIYRGTAPFSEPETQAMRDLAARLGARAVLYWDVHTYGRLILWPWGYTSARPEAVGLYQRWDPGLSQVMQTGGQTYRAGQGNQTLYATSGAAKDSMYGSRDALSWTIELTNTGFTAPPGEIRISGEEVYRGVAWMARNLCRADFNRDGFIDFFDYDAYLGAFESGALRADYNLDGFADFFDYTDFVTAFETGC